MTVQGSDKSTFEQLTRQVGRLFETRAHTVSQSRIRAAMSCSHWIKEILIVIGGPVALEANILHG